MRSAGLQNSGGVALVSVDLSGGLELTGTRSPEHMFPFDAGGHGIKQHFDTWFPGAVYQAPTIAYVGQTNSAAKADPDYGWLYCLKTLAQGDSGHLGRGQLAPARLRDVGTAVPPSWLVAG